MTEENKCGCGRSPTGKLSEEDYLKKKENYEANKTKKN